MGLRGFMGADGQEWQVWDTRPSPSPNVGLPHHRSADVSSEPMAEIARLSKKREGGWLTFTTSGERRRLSPIPDGWESADEPSLRTFLAAADRIVARDGEDAL